MVSYRRGTLDAACPNQRNSFFEGHLHKTWSGVVLHRSVAQVEWYVSSVCRLPPNLLMYAAFPRSSAAWIPSVPGRLKIYGAKIQVIPKRETHSGNLGRGCRYTKFEVNQTNIKWVMISAVPSVSSVHVELDDRLPSTAGRTDETTKLLSVLFFCSLFFFDFLQGQDW